VIISVLKTIVLLSKKDKNTSRNYIHYSR